MWFVSDNMQIGFLTGIYFLASAIVGLTLVYFSRPRLKIKDLKDNLEPLVKVNVVETGIQAESQKNSSSKQPEVVVKPVEISTKVDKLPEPTLVADKRPESTSTKEESDMIKFEILNKRASEKPEAMVKPNTAAAGAVVQPPLITVTNAPKAQAQAAALVKPVQDKPAQGPMNNAEVKEEKPKADTITVSPPSQTVNENSTKNDGEDKSKSANSNDDFSELFTEDTEETEATRLAKEMNDVDTDDLLQTSQDLISQFKRKN